MPRFVSGVSYRHYTHAGKERKLTSEQEVSLLRDEHAASVIVLFLSSLKEETNYVNEELAS